MKDISIHKYECESVKLINYSLQNYIYDSVWETLYTSMDVRLCERLSNTLYTSMDVRLCGRPSNTLYASMDVSLCERLSNTLYTSMDVRLCGRLSNTLYTSIYIGIYLYDIFSYSFYMAIVYNIFL